jgi:hypothetical protein
MRIPQTLFILLVSCRIMFEYSFVHPPPTFIHFLQTERMSKPNRFHVLDISRYFSTIRWLIVAPQGTMQWFVISGSSSSIGITINFDEDSSTKKRQLNDKPFFDHLLLAFWTHCDTVREKRKKYKTTQKRRQPENWRIAKKVEHALIESNLLA